MKGAWFPAFFSLLFHLKLIHPNLVSILKHPTRWIPSSSVGNIPGSAVLSLQNQPWSMGRFARLYMIISTAVSLECLSDVSPTHFHPKPLKNRPKGKSMHAVLSYCSKQFIVSFKNCLTLCLSKAAEHCRMTPPQKESGTDERLQLHPGCLGFFSFSFKLKYRGSLLEAILIYQNVLDAIQ